LGPWFDERVICDLCGASGGTTVLEGGDRRFGLSGRFSVVRCVSCGLARTEPQPEDPGAYYPASEYYSYATPSVSPLTRAAVASRYGRREGSLARLAATRISALPPGPPGELLDVGSGSGAMLLALEGAGWRGHGIELDEGAVRAANEAGLDRVQAGDLLDAGYESGSFDVVRFSHSLEHMRSPRAELAEARRILRPGGRLAIAVPDFGALLRRVFGERWFFLDLPRHLWHFDRRTLPRLVRESGFEVTRVRNVTASSAILGTIDYLRGRRETLTDNAIAWYAAQPFAALLDVLRLGDELELIAVAR
jgi:SAM-dependent methyltransferase